MRAVVHDRYGPLTDTRHVELVRKLGATVVHGTYPLEAIVEASRYVEAGQKTGKLVLTVA